MTLRRAATRTSPFFSSRSSLIRLEHAAATFFALSATACAASSTDEPAVTVWRLAKRAEPERHAAVSPATTVTSLGSTPSSDGADLRQRGAEALPIAAAPVNT